MSELLNASRSAWLAVKQAEEIIERHGCPEVEYLRIDWWRYHSPPEEKCIVKTAEMAVGAYGDEGFHVFCLDVTLRRKEDEWSVLKVFYIAGAESVHPKLRPAICEYVDRLIAEVGLGDPTEIELVAQKDEDGVLASLEGKLYYGKERHRPFTIEAEELS